MDVAKRMRPPSMTYTEGKGTRAVASALLSETAKPSSVCACCACPLGSVTIPNRLARILPGSERTVNPRAPLVWLCAVPSAVWGETATSCARAPRAPGGIPLVGAERDVAVRAPRSAVEDDDGHGVVADGGERNGLASTVSRSASGAVSFAPSALTGTPAARSSLCSSEKTAARRSPICASKPALKSSICWAMDGADMCGLPGEPTRASVRGAYVRHGGSGATPSRNGTQRHTASSTRAKGAPPTRSAAPPSRQYP